MRTETFGRAQLGEDEKGQSDIADQIDEQVLALGRRGGCRGGGGGGGWLCSYPYPFGVPCSVFSGRCFLASQKQ
ncbi:hypothetical protein Ga0100230_005410 [Opitutaceae bacterium TAV3]|nr:hypothetical protein Ga0100230_005410 [Opitutaceae bacterium TAV3]